MQCRALIAAQLALTAMTAIPAAADEIDFATQTSALEIRPLDTLPANPKKAGNDAMCPVLIDTPVTAAGQRVAASGWLVSSETEVNGLTLVSFVGSAEQGTSGTCLLSDGNVGIFREDRLRGLIYADPEVERGIGSLEAMDGDRVRIWDGDYLGQPLADIQIVGADLVILGQVATRDSFCKGQVSVPNLYGLPIHLARKALLAEGWSPAPSPDDLRPWIFSMRDSWPELQDCSGTGLGFCAWEYTKGPGQNLSVTTAGENPDGSSPIIVGFGVTCAG